MTIGQTIKLYRKEKNLTQGQLAELLGVSVQAVSKWETDTGMPDISQIVPLAKVLEVSTDKLLGYTNEAYEKELQEIRNAYGGINFIKDLKVAAGLYGKALQFFNKYPDVPEVALKCLECYTELFAKGAAEVSCNDFLEECERYGSSIFRYESNPDNLCKTYYLLSRAYNLCGETTKAESIMKNLPYIYGDREYWEAEMAYADEKYELALEKIKKSFAMKARFMARSIRLAGWITRAQSEGKITRESIALNEYMLKLINAFLAGGDYLPRRQIFQKASLLPYLVKAHLELGNKEQAKQYLDELYQTREEYFEFLDHPEGKHCLMFAETQEDGPEDFSREDMNQAVEMAEKAMQEAEKRTKNT